MQSLLPNRSLFSAATKSLQIVIFGLLAVLATQALAAAPSYSLNAEQLHKILGQDKLVIIDIRDAESYENGHIPGAINIPYEDFHYQKPNKVSYILKPFAFKKLMEKKGVANDSTVVIYGELANLNGSRIFWAFDLYGHKNHKILDGGLQDWRQHHYPEALKPTTLAKSHFTINIHPEYIATKFQTFMATKGDEYVIIDARPTDQFAGKDDHKGRIGYIPHAINIPWYELVSNRSMKDEKGVETSVSKLESNQKLKALFAGIPKDKKILLYCNTGSEASVLFLALKKIDRHAKIYDGSWSEWRLDNSMPLVKPKQ